VFFETLLLFVVELFVTELLVTELFVVLLLVTELFVTLVVVVDDVVAVVVGVDGLVVGAVAWHEAGLKFFTACQSRQCRLAGQGCTMCG
jgi:hypothetical protein